MRAFRLLTAVLALTVLCAAAASARTKTSLNTGWKFHKGDPATASENNFSDTSWTTVNIPHTWNVNDPFDDEPGYYRGPGWYRRELIVDRTLVGKHLFLYFEGASQVADVYVNGQKAGSHIGGYSAFSFDITSLTKPGRNLIAVRVDNSFNEDIPPLTADFNFYGGIYRDVWLIATDKTHLSITDRASSGVTISTPYIQRGEGIVAIDGIVNADPSTPDITVLTSIFDASKRWVDTSTSRIGDDGRFVLNMGVRKPRLWSPDSPYLYSVKISVRSGSKIIDEIEQPLGFRWYNFDGEKGFSLNGKPLKLHGVNRHQDHAGLGNTVPDRLHVRDMEIIKDAGFNFVRLAHYPQDPSVLEACDRLGLLVWEETPIVNYITKSDAFADNSANMVRDMIRQHRNHPSVILWGYMNEIYLRVPKGRDDLYPATVELARRLNSIAKEEDPSRLTTIAFHGNDIYNKTGLGDIPDVIGWNLYQGWYSATVEDFGKFLDDQHKRFPKRPLIVSEYGANGDRRLHSTQPRRFDSTTEYQRYYHESYMAQMEARPYLSGSALWNEFDFGAELRGETIPHLNQKGMYTFDRKPKDIHFFYKAKLSKQGVLHIAVGDQLKRVGVPSAKETVDVYSNMSSVELFQNGKSLGKKTVDGGRKASWDVTWRSGANVLAARASNRRTPITDTALVTFAPVTAASNEIAINVGSNASFIDSDGRVWIADQPYSKGSWGYIGEKATRIYSQPPDRNILRTDSDPLFQTMVEGLTEYRFDVPDGEYEIELLFAETKNERAGMRVFDVLIGERIYLGSFDPVAMVGRDRPFRKMIRAESKGGLSIKFGSKIGEPILNGILVRRISRR
ncbi:MAG: glycoside hydrolase family 2 [Acidobacteria bacterium]|nr:MAG: glycoside hydrolase family 2 [Acidobacteriota bacterium]